jgi:hypothetical protein
MVLLAFSGGASADPPLRVARLGYTSGTVSFSADGESDWVEASLNRPLTTGDRLWADADSRAEIQIDAAMIRVNANTAFSILNLDDQIAQLQLTQGTLNLRVRSLSADQLVEVDTPNLAFVVRQAGAYRIEVTPDGNATTVIVRKGQADVYSEDAAYVIDSRQPYRFFGTGLRDYQYVDIPRLDEFDRWASERDDALEHSDSARFVSPQVVGYQDLDANGSWRVNASYGNVWFPNRVRLGWSPFYDGHWAWINPWGWTWVDDAPWGFTVSHYGRWANVDGAWGWVPGPVRSRAYYAPALVMFLGGNNMGLMQSSDHMGDVAWFPLAPREVYRPSYPVSRGYFVNVNRSNTVINNTVINNTYNVTNVSNIVYANRSVPGAVVAVPRKVFGLSQPVSTVAVRVSHDLAANAQLTVSAPVLPTERSARRAPGSGDRPQTRAFERSVVSRATPPAHVGVTLQPQQLTARPGDTRAKPEVQTERTALPLGASSPLASPSPLPAQAVRVPQAQLEQLRSLPPQNGRGEPRVHPAAALPPPPALQRSLESKVVSPPVAAPIASTQVVAPSAASTKLSGPTSVVQEPTVQTSAIRHKPVQPEPAAVTLQSEPRPLVAAPVKSPQTQVAPKEYVHVEPKLAASKPKDLKLDSEDARRAEENRKSPR